MKRTKQPNKSSWKQLKEARLIIVGGLLFTLIACALTLIRPAWVEEGVEALLLDFRFQIRNLINPPPPPDDIVIIAIDEKSLEKHGRWPWPRDLQAELLRKTLAYSPRVIAIDIFYAEPETASRDQLLGATLDDGYGKIIMGGGFALDEASQSNAPDYLLDSAILKVQDYSQLGQVIRSEKLKSSVEEIYAHAQIGHVVSPPDADGKLRWEHLYLNFQDEFYPSLAIFTTTIALGKKLEDITIEGNRGVSIGDQFIPTDPLGRMRVNYLGPEKSIPYLSAADILSGTLPDNAVHDKVVFIGTTAISTYDFMVTPFSARAPAIEKNATIVENILRQRFIGTVPYLTVLILILASGIFLTFYLPLVRAGYGMSVAFMIIAGFATINQLLFSFFDLYLNFVYPLSNLCAITILFTAYKYFTEERRAKELRQIFSSYVSPKIVNQIIEHPEMARLGGYRGEVTVLFSDVRSFTSFSETRQPEEVVEMLNEYLGEMAGIVFHWDGTLDKFVGDEIMAFWGAPLAQPGHAELALRCALHMSDRLNELQEKWRQEGKPILDCGIGLNTGTVLIGNIGAAGKKMDYTIIGDHVNLGARTEALTRNYDCRILITEFTLNKVAALIESGVIGHVKLIEAERVKVKGKEVPVTVYRIDSIQEDRQQES